MTMLQNRPVDADTPPEQPTPSWFRKALDIVPERRVVEVGDKRLESLAWGPVGAPGVLLLHGNMAHARWWSVIAPLLMDRYRLVAFSFSGMGGSSHARPYTLEGYAEEASAVADAWGLGDDGARYTVIGHSAGGGVAGLMADAYGARLDRAIMVDSLISPTKPEFNPAEDRPNRVYASVEEALSRYRLVPAQPETNRFLIEWLARASLEAVEGGWAWSFDPALRGQFAARSAWNSIGRAAVPLVFINGGLSQLMTPSRIAALQSHVPAALFLTVPEADHHVLIDQPVALAGVIGAVLDQAQAHQHLPDGVTR